MMCTKASTEKSNTYTVYVTCLIRLSEERSWSHEEGVRVVFALEENQI